MSSFYTINAKGNAVNANVDADFDYSDSAMDVDLPSPNQTQDAQVLCRMASLRLDSDRPTFLTTPTSDEGDEAFIPPTPRIPQGPFSPSLPIYSAFDELNHLPPPPAIPESSYFDLDIDSSLSTDSFADILTPSTPPRYHSRDVIGLGFTGLLKSDGSGLPLDGLGVLSHRLDSPSVLSHDSYGSSIALLSEVYMTFSRPEEEREEAPVFDKPPSPFLLRRSQLPPLGEVSPGRVCPAVFEDVFWGREDEGGKGNLRMGSLMFTKD